MAYRVFKWGWRIVSRLSLMKDPCTTSPDCHKRCWIGQNQEDACRTRKPAPGPAPPLPNWKAVTKITDHMLCQQCSAALVMTFFGQNLIIVLKLLSFFFFSSSTWWPLLVLSCFVPRQLDFVLNLFVLPPQGRGGMCSRGFHLTLFSLRDGRAECCLLISLSGQRGLDTWAP